MTSSVACPPEVVRAVEDHVHSDVSREVGGVLVGTMDEGAATVEAALPALRAIGRSANVTFTHEVWEEILAVVDRDQPGRRIVGWYHSHPGFGVFLSDYDRFIHQGFFSDERMLALVVDPKAGQAGWFGWRDGQIEQVGQFGVRAAAVDPGTALSGTGRSGPAPALVSMLLALVAFAAGFGLAGRAQPAAGGGADADALPAARARVRALQAEVGRLRAALKTAEPPAAAPVVRYRVRRGDTLSKIARFFYGDAAGYPRIVAANRGLDPDRLAVGQQLAVPLDPVAGKDGSRA
jgi:proteasome lid subunit RPN8/RPN11/phage tail protein X